MTGVDLFGCPVPGHEVFETIHLVVCDAFEDPFYHASGSALFMRAVWVAEGNVVIAGEIYDIYLNRLLKNPTLDVGTGR